MIRKVQAKKPTKHDGQVEIYASEGWGSWGAGRATAQQVGHPGSSLGLSFLLCQAKVTAGKRLHMLRELKLPDSVQSCLPHLRGWASVSPSVLICAQLSWAVLEQQTDQSLGPARGRSMERLGVAQTSHERAVSYWVSRQLAV